LIEILLWANAMSLKFTNSRLVQSNPKMAIRKSLNDEYFIWSIEVILWLTNEVAVGNPQSMDCPNRKPLGLSYD
jgi:hypothetical protein